MIPTQEQKFQSQTKRSRARKSGRGMSTWINHEDWVGYRNIKMGQGFTPIDTDGT
jgi:hypothetical protein